MRQFISKLCVFLLVIMTLLSGGCTRRFFRTFADKDSENLITEKNRFPAWQLEQFHVYPDPRARFADPSNPDRPPKPPDDPAAEMSSPNPQPGRLVGTARFEGDGYLRYLECYNEINRCERAEAAQREKGAKETAGPAPEIQPAGVLEVASQPGPAAAPDPYQVDAENPNSQDTDISKVPTYLIRLDQASELSLFNSREFQTRREDVFLAALPVSLERFGFAAQFFATERAFRERLGKEYPGGPANRWRLDSQAGFSRLFPSGALLLLRFANQTVINLTGAGPHTISTSNLNLDIVQPLLRGGGYAVTLEPLTQAERNLLYAIREFARFRKEFYVSVAGGGDATSPRFIPGFNSAFLGGGSIAANFAGGLVSPSEGYLPTVLRYAVLGNEQENVRALEGFLKRFQAFKEGGDIADLQVGQVEQQLLQGRSTVLQRRLELRDSLDRFKIQLGIPTAVPLDLDDRPIRPIAEHIRKFPPLFEELKNTREVAIGYEKLPADQLRGKLRELFTTAPIVRGTKFVENIINRFAEWERLSADDLRGRISLVEQELRAIESRRAEREKERLPPDPKDTRRADELTSQLQLGQFEQALRQYEQKPWEKQPVERAALIRATLFSDLVNRYNIVLGEARDERLDQLRNSWPSLPRVCVNGKDLIVDDLDESMAVAARTALENRFDLMNSRAQLVDAWRQIAIQANSLLGVFDVRYNLDSNTPPGLAKPLAFNGSRTRHQLILSGELPLVRRAERNNYRASLIAYQRQRRNLQAAEDFIVNSVRSQLRQLRVLAQNYRIQQRQLELAYLQVDNSAETFNAPQPPGQGGNQAASAAALTQQLLNAQRSLPQAQNQLYSIWINYQITRLLLYRDLERMPLDYQGVWTDDVADECPCESATQQRDDESQPPASSDSASQ